MRGHTDSVFQSPTGITGARVSAARRAAPQRPLAPGSKKAGPRGIVPCGDMEMSSPARSAWAAASSGSSEPDARTTRMPPNALAKPPMTGASKTSFLPRKRAVRPARAITRLTGDAVEVAAVVEDQDAGPVDGDVLDAAQLEAGVRHQLGPVERRAASSCSSTPGDLHDAGRHVEVTHRPALQAGQRVEAGVGVHGDGVADRGEQAGRRRSCRSRRSSCAGRRRSPWPSAARPAASPGPSTGRRRWCRRSGRHRRRPAGADHVVEAEPGGEGAEQRLGRGAGEHQAPPGGTVLLEQLAGVGLDLVSSSSAAASAAASTASTGQPAGRGRGEAGELHLNPALTGALVEPHERLEDRQVALAEAGFAQVALQDRAGRARDERAIEVEDGRGVRDRWRDLAAALADDLAAALRFPPDRFFRGCFRRGGGASCPASCTAVSVTPRTLCQ